MSFFDLLGVSASPEELAKEPLKTKDLPMRVLFRN